MSTGRLFKIVGPVKKKDLYYTLWLDSSLPREWHGSSYPTNGLAPKTCMTQAYQKSGLTQAYPKSGLTQAHPKSGKTQAYPKMAWLKLTHRVAWLKLTKRVA